MQLESKLVPALRDGVDVIKLVLFKELKKSVGAQHPDLADEEVPRLAAAVLNELFGTLTDEEPQASFAREHKASIQVTLRSLAQEHPGLRSPLTDALRMQLLCDADEGIESDWILSQADELGVLVRDQEMPLPERFMNLVRVLGIAHGLLDPAQFRTS